MNEKNLRMYAELMRDMDLTGLEITENDCKLRLERNLPATPAAVPAAPVMVAAPAPAPAAGTAPAPAPAEEYTDAAIVTSPMVGVFYCAPAENAEPFVKPGDTVKKGDVLCIIESMKLMNEIVAEQDCTILEVCVSNKQAVDFGHTLFKIKE